MLKKHIRLQLILDYGLEDWDGDTFEAGTILNVGERHQKYQVLNVSRLGNRFCFQANSLDCFVPPTWPTWKPPFLL